MQGVPSAKDLCLLAKKDMPELFNPLKSEIQDQNDILTNDTTKDSINRKKWNPTAKQLYNAIMFFFYRFGIDPDKPLFKVKNEIEENIDREPDIVNIKIVNSVLRKYKTTARKILNTLEKKNNLKEFSFDLLISQLNAIGEKQFFE